MLNPSISKPPNRTDHDFEAIPTAQILAMPPRIDLDPYKDEILDLISQNTTQAAIRSLLQDKYDIVASRSVLQAPFQNGGPPYIRSHVRRKLISRLVLKNSSLSIIPVILLGFLPQIVRLLQNVLFVESGVILVLNFASPPRSESNSLPILKLF